MVTRKPISLQFDQSYLLLSDGRESVENDPSKFSTSKLTQKPFPGYDNLIMPPNPLKQTYQLSKGSRDSLLIDCKKKHSLNHLFSENSVDCGTVYPEIPPYLKTHQTRSVVCRRLCYVMLCYVINQRI